MLQRSPRRGRGRASEAGRELAARRPSAATSLRLAGGCPGRRRRPTRDGHLLGLHVQEGAQQCEADAQPIVHGDRDAEPDDGKANVCYAPAAVDESVRHGVDLLEDEKVHLIVDVVEQAVEAKQPRRLAASAEERDQDRPLEEEDRRQQQQHAVVVYVQEERGVVHVAPQLCLEHLGADGAGGVANVGSQREAEADPRKARLGHRRDGDAAHDGKEREEDGQRHGRRVGEKEHREQHRRERLARLDRVDKGGVDGAERAVRHAKAERVDEHHAVEAPRLRRGGQLLVPPEPRDTQRKGASGGRTHVLHQRQRHPRRAPLLKLLERLFGRRVGQRARHIPHQDVDKRLRREDSRRERRGVLAGRPGGRVVGQRLQPGRAAHIWRVCAAAHRV
mmetsp:Transcript_3827/g.11316  ORF Transcript_3827/g.11316 Transcript_3827/m.11316 type:complete len:391 (+) Transcript_3827:325-1497(+)